VQDNVKLAFASSIANEALWAISLQCRRLRANEPEDEKFPARFWVDIQFLVVTLRRFRKAIEIARSVPNLTPEITLALKTFNDAIPDLDKMRNVGEHLDDYAWDNPTRHRKEVSHRDIQVGSWSSDTGQFNWLGSTLNIDVSLKAAEELYFTYRKAIKQKGYVAKGADVIS